MRLRSIVRKPEVFLFPVSRLQVGVNGLRKVIHGFDTRFQRRIPRQNASNIPRHILACKLARISHVKQGGRWPLDARMSETFHARNEAPVAGEKKGNAPHGYETIMGSMLDVDTGRTGDTGHSRGTIVTVQSPPTAHKKGAPFRVPQPITRRP